MADGKELKPKSFRIDDETAEKFKEISNTIGGSQQDTLAKLIQVFEFQAGKTILTEKKADIELFERYTNALVRMFMGSLEDNQNITETVRTEFDALLRSKDAIIQELQSKLTIAKQQKEESTVKAKTFTDENQRLKDCIESLNNEYNAKMCDMQTMLADKDNLNKALTDSCNNLKTKENKANEAIIEAENLHKELEELKKELEDLQNQVSHLKNEIEQKNKTILDMQKHESDSLELLRNQLQLENEKNMLDIKKDYQEQINKLTVEKQTEIDKYQQKYLSLLEQKESKTTKPRTSTTKKNV